MTWGSDPSAVFTVTRAAVLGIVWNVSMTVSGHMTRGGGDFPSQVASAMTWADPLNSGFYSNLTYVDDNHWRLETMSPIPVNTFNEGFGVFGNGTSIYAGSDYNSDDVFASVNVVPAPAAAVALAMGGLAAVRRRRR